MTIETQLTKAKFYGNGAATVWPLPYPVLLPEHVFVIATNMATEEDTLIAPNLYEVHGVGTNSVYVKYPLSGTPVMNGTKLTIYRLLPHIQETDMENGAAYDAEVVETTFDNLVMQIQQLREELDRAIKVAISSDMTPEELLAKLLEAEKWAQIALEAALRAENAADLAELASYVKNVWRSWTATADIAEGGILTLPSPYYPKRAMLLLFHQGTVCALRDRWLPGAPQFEEVGDSANIPSYQVRVLFPVKAGEELSMWVVASNAYEVNERVAQMLEEAKAAIERAGGEADRAKDEADRSAAEADRSAGEADRSKSEADRAEAAANQAGLASSLDNLYVAWTAGTAIASGAVITIPGNLRYYPGRNMVRFTHQGTDCALGVQYEEVGDPAADTASEQLKVLFDVKAGEQLTVWIVASNVSRYMDEMEAALQETRQNVAGALEAENAAELAASEAGVSAGLAQSSAADAAIKAAQIQELTASATTLQPGSEATAAYSPATGVLSLGIPRGEKGEQGDAGEPGQDGTSVTILGQFDDPSQLPATGTPGDAYLIDGDLYVWSANTGGWDNVGTIQGPKGDTPPLSDAVDSASSTTAASSLAVKTVNDKLFSTRKLLTTEQVNDPATLAGSYRVSTQTAQDVGLPGGNYMVLIEQLNATWSMQTWKNIVSSSTTVDVYVRNAYSGTWGPFKRMASEAYVDARIALTYGINYATATADQLNDPTLAPGQYSTDPTNAVPLGLPSAWYLVDVRKTQTSAYAKQIYYNVFSDAVYYRSYLLASASWNAFKQFAWTDSPAVNAPPMPQVGTGLGQWTGRAAEGSTLTVPSGGTWAHFAFGCVNGVPQIVGSGVVPGGFVVAMTNATSIFSLCWRIR